MNATEHLGFRLLWKVTDQSKKPSASWTGRTCQSSRRSLAANNWSDLGDGIEIIWTPAADPNGILGIPALEGVTLKPAVWVYPPGPKTEQILIILRIRRITRTRLFGFQANPKLRRFTCLSISEVVAIIVITHHQ